MIEWGQVNYGGMDQDMHAKDPRRDQFYYEGQNITLVFNRQLSRNVVSNERGNRLLVTLPHVFTSITNTDIITHATATTYNQATTGYIERETYGSRWYTSGSPVSITAQSILGGAFLKDKLIIISTDQGGNGHLLVWQITYDDDFDATINLKFLGLDANMDDSKLITKIITLYESAESQKVYWVDNGQNQMRVVNIAASDPFNIHKKTIDATPQWDFYSPAITNSFSDGGYWTNGRGLVQYGYRLFTKHGPVTRMSPLSALAPITKNNRGLSSTEEGTVSIEVEIATLDTSYEYVEVYRFHHDSGNDTECHLIYEGAIDDGQTSLTIVDVGDNSEITAIGDPEFLLTTPAGPYYPKTMEFKDNRIFLGNITTIDTDIDYDSRAYQFTSGGSCQTLDVDGNNENNITSSTYPTDETLDSIVRGYDQDPDGAFYMTNIYQSDGSTLGAEGPNVAVEFEIQTLGNNQWLYAHNYQEAAYKRNEVYRFGVQFFDKWGNGLFVKWIGDLRIPSMQELSSGQLYASNAFNAVYPKFTFNSVNGLGDNVYGLRIVRAPTTYADRAIKSQAYVNSVVYHSGNRNQGSAYVNTMMPSYMLRYYYESLSTIHNNITNNRDLYNGSTTLYSELNAGASRYINRNNYLSAYIPESYYGVDFGDDIDSSYSLHIVGGAVDDSDAYYTDANDNDGFRALSSWEYLFNSDQPNSGGNSWRDLGGPNAEPSGVERFAWILHQKASTVETAFQHGSDIFLPISDAGKLNDSSSLETISGDRFRGYGFVTGGLSTAPTDAIDFRYRTPKHWILDVGTDFESEITTNDDVVNDNNTTRKAYVLADIWEDPDNITRYSGEGHRNRQSQEYIPCSAVFKITGSSVANKRAFQGDCFPQKVKMLIATYDEVTSSDVSVMLDPEFMNHSVYDTSTAPYARPGSGGFSGYDRANGYYVQSCTTLIELPMECYINPAMVEGTWNIDDLKIIKDPREIVPAYNSIYHKQNTYLKARPRPYNFIPNLENGILTRYSDTNVPNSWTDGHCIFRIANQSNVDPRFGDITAFHVFKENLIVVQEYGTGMWLVNPTNVVGTTGGPTTLGTGSVLQDYRVLSDSYGTKFTFGSVTGEQGVYILDLSRNKFVKITNDENPLSDLQGMHALLQDLPRAIIDDPYNEGTMVRLSYDPLTHNVYISVLYDDGSSGGAGS